MTRGATTSILTDAIAGRVTMATLSTEQYHRMVESGLLGESTNIELIDGLLVRKDRSHAGDDGMTVGREHAWVITQLQKLTGAVAAASAQLRLQLPITLSTHDEPEPDAAIVRPDARDYAAGHPTAADVFCVIEVADSSLAYDRTTKRRVYAEAGIALYVIVNLPDRCCEVFADPNRTSSEALQPPAILRPGDILDLPTGRGPLAVPVANLLPTY